MKVTLVFSLTCVLPSLLLFSQDFKPKIQSQNTIIRSDRCEFSWKDTKNFFLFDGNVHIVANNLSLYCDMMEVYSIKESIAENSTKEMGAIEKIIAIGKVVIQQSGRRSESGKAEILPLTGKIILTENPVIFEDQGEVRGNKMTLFRGKRRALVEGRVGEQVQIKLPQIEDLGFEENHKVSD